MPTPASPPRPRGAPPGNHNALKHGFYSRSLNRRDLAGLEQAELVELKDEISLMRIFIRRAIDLAQGTDDIFETAYLLRTVSFAVTTLNRLIRTQLTLSASNNPFQKALEQVLIEFNEEMARNADAPPSSPSLAGPSGDSEVFPSLDGLLSGSVSRPSP